MSQRRDAKAGIPLSLPPLCWLPHPILPPHSTKGQSFLGVCFICLWGFFGVFVFGFSVAVIVLVFVVCFGFCFF